MENTAQWENRITWSDELATGNEKIDEQHKTIFKITNSFIEKYIQGESKASLGEMLDFLINYTVEHFNYEEELMTEHDYPAYEYHKKCHDDFKITVGDLKKDFEIRGRRTN